MLKYTDTPVIEIASMEAEMAGLRLLVKREDLNHPFVSGNKWWKLKYNLEKAKLEGCHCLLTFGGAFSNHIYATAAAAKELGFSSIGIIRGEEVLPLNGTLSFAKSCGMELQFVSRADYRRKSEAHFVDDLKKKFGHFYQIPEGGSNALAVRGCAEFAREKLSGVDFDYLCVATGTGGTLAGITEGLAGKKKVIGFSVLKNGDFLNDEVARFHAGGRNEYPQWTIQTQYHFGGYAKRTAALNQFIGRMNQQHHLPLDATYTGKMVAGVFDLITKNYFARGSTVLLLHTGGLRSE